MVTPVLFGSSPITAKGHTDFSICVACSLLDSAMADEQEEEERKLLPLLGGSEPGSV